MKMRKKAGIVIASVVTGVLMASVSFAASWATCTPTKLGPYVESGADVVRLAVSGCTADPTAGKGWVTLNPSSSDQMMATILTAMSLGKTVGVGYDNAITSSGYNVAQGIMLKN